MCEDLACLQRGQVSLLQGPHHSSNCSYADHRPPLTPRIRTHSPQDSTWGRSWGPAAGSDVGKAGGSCPTQIPSTTLFRGRLGH